MKDIVLMILGICFVGSLIVSFYSAVETDETLLEKDKEIKALEETLELERTRLMNCIKGVNNG